MATGSTALQFVLDQLSLVQGITHKKLFGEYGLWREGKFFGTVEEWQLYLKPTPAVLEMLGDPPLAEPHAGARLILVEDLEDRERLRRLVETTCSALPAPKPRKKKTDKA